MNSRSVILVGLVACCALGGCKRSEQAPAPPPLPSAPVAAPGEYDRRIAAAQQVVAQDPRNVRAWIELGNDYFDTQQRQRAIDAYGKALEIQPNDPDVLTDQGVMYRELGSFDKAIANFKKANELQPMHLQSLFNLGVVYGQDLKDSEKALQAWRRIVEIAPTSPQAAQARQAIQELQGRPVAR